MLKNYKWAKGYKGPTGDPNEEWFAYYSFINPGTGRFERIKVKEGLNYYHDLKEKETFLKELVDEINKNLKAGYNPFDVPKIEKDIVQEIVDEKHREDNPKSPLLTHAFIDFLNNKRGKDLAKPTIDAYEGYVGKFENYLFEAKKADIRLDQIDAKFISDMLEWLKVHHDWNGTTYNNHLNYWVTLLNWFAKKPRFWIKREEFDIGTDGEIEHKNTKPMKNQYFGDTVAENVKKAMLKYPKVLYFSQFIYFSCMRPDEIRNLKVENVDIKGRYIKIIGKTKSRTVPICDELAEMLTSLRLEQFPANYYVIGYQAEVSDQMHSENYFTRVFREDIRKPLGLSDNFTMYGWKHTRVVDLLNAGYTDAEIMNLTGHRDTASYDKYKRELIGHMNTRLRGKTIGWDAKSLVLTSLP
ncbi:tyrosine-type recombinase/integrase [Pedobacter metabolipauper]|uniref:Site-specific recombinase XerD n=1 Tax=Pedobacter metabolipauper TaxID=425513 RepID=A0A4R6T130_9SPHI|nr:tyrosine-type recombinase/integrase [Pedobacter metabolipauper]TDQ12152.1 site-specific recombinase XerD [Pedobacter metabolipauper]